ncbi:GntR family transcriptional regulator [Oscillospiraceae bacterium Marseille-Q3528]|nr:GntR family transcriptional regulator [Oscillospiraceae bacterium Marseille-Q3528]WNV59323.1 GntR family transcriptional regulator [Oscillospiraceae bacterium NTUH-002-81]
MPWNLDNNRPIYLQLVERIQMDIVSGVYHAGDKLPSVRELAADAAVNPNTMQKAFTELERSGLVYTQRTNGRYITEDQERISRVREELARECTQSYLSNIRRLGYEREQALALAQKIIEEGTL